jgi:hypothetical protein
MIVGKLSPVWLQSVPERRQLVHSHSSEELRDLVCGELLPFCVSMIVVLKVQLL